MSRDCEPMLPIPYRVADRRVETRDSVTLRLEPVAERLPRFRPGQFTMLYAHGIGEVAISISGDPSRADDVLTQTIRQRIDTRPPGSYTARLLDEGQRRIAQKVGEEGLELALASVAQGEQEVIAEAADLLYHVMLLLEAKGLSLARVVAELAARGSSDS